MASPEKIAAIKNENERKFAEVFFDHDEWESQPDRLIFSGFTYRPDFLDKKRNVYIEVVGTRQAMSQGKAKYVKAFETLPNGEFELRNPEGKLINLDYVPQPEAQNMDEARQIEMEQWVIDYLDRLRLRMKPRMSVEKWAEFVYPGIPGPTARMRLQNLRKPQGANSKRKRLLFSEFTRMARALGKSPSEVCTLAEGAFDALDEKQSPS